MSGRGDFAILRKGKIFIKKSFKNHSRAIGRRFFGKVCSRFQKSQNLKSAVSRKSDSLIELKLKCIELKKLKTSRQG